MAYIKVQAKIRKLIMSSMWFILKA